ncbi:hypothetical protein [uncultured Desulfovibrio sp.]|uniref:hypothetical protein n=1 Tax=uncultured Desulfovibrio sp. TaxID=167968 RepID=UPI0028056C3E|nr:hypothetical protein [uncultured Desulfovibrio sp.]
MRILFISNYFPGDLGPLARQLAAAPGNEVLFASNRQRKDYALDGVRRVRLKNAPLFGAAAPTVPQLWEETVKRGGGGLRSLLALRQSWGAPDIIFASLAGGAAFFAPQAFPEAFLVTYAETGLKNFSLLPEAARGTWSLLQSALFLQARLCFAFSERQRWLFPEPVRERIHLVPPCVDTGIFSPEAASPWDAGDDAGAGAAAPLLTLDAAGLEGQRLAALLGLGRAVLQALPECRVVMLTENGNLRQALEAAAGAWPAVDHRRFAVHASLPFDRYRDLLAASRLVVCPGADAAERTLLECMSCETLLMARATAANFLRPGVNMLELPGAPEAAARAVVLTLAQDRRELAPVARMARRNVLAHFSEDAVAPAHLARVMQAHAAWKKERGRA